MTTLTMRVVKGDFIVTGPVQDAPRGARLVQDAPSRLADHGGWLRPLHSSGWNDSARLAPSLRAFEKHRQQVFERMEAKRKAEEDSNQRRVALTADDRVRA